MQATWMVTIARPGQPDVKCTLYKGRGPEIGAEVRSTISGKTVRARITHHHLDNPPNRGTSLGTWTVTAEEIV